jgi:hypothetical protein
MFARVGHEERQRCAVEPAAGGVPQNLLSGDMANGGAQMDTMHGSVHGPEISISAGTPEIRECQTNTRRGIPSSRELRVCPYRRDRQSLLSSAGQGLFVQSAKSGVCDRAIYFANPQEARHSERNEDPLSCEQREAVVTAPNVTGALSAANRVLPRVAPRRRGRKPLPVAEDIAANPRPAPCLRRPHVPGRARSARSWVNLLLQQHMRTSEILED